ncbi:MAG: hypothetical protein V1808_01360 [Candidatus Daviesbacteria bacterium]
MSSRHLEEEKAPSTPPITDTEKQSWQKALQTVVALYHFLAGTVNLMDKDTRLKVADSLERQMRDNFINAIVTDPSLRLNIVDPSEVNELVKSHIGTLRGEDPIRDDIRKLKGLE